MITLFAMIATLDKPPIHRPQPIEVVASQKPALRVLVFSKTAGFRHDSIAAGVKAIEKMEKIEITHTEDAAIFADRGLGRFDVVVFLNTTGDVLNPEQQTAFESFIEGGRGYVGIHAASDTEYDWPWYGRLVGAYFKGHPAIQEATVKIEKNTAETKGLPKEWKRRDEWYNFRANPRANVEVLASLDEKSYKGGDMGDHPIMWRTKVGKGRGWYTGFGHTAETYAEPMFLESLYQGIRWASGR